MLYQNKKYEQSDQGGGSNENKQSMLSKLRGIKHIEIIIAVIAVVILLIIYFTSFSDTSSSDSDVALTNSYDYCSAVQSDLEEKISLIDGAGETVVLISWSESEEYVLAYSYSSSGSETVVTNSGEVFITKTIYPVPIGVVVICEGGNSVAVKLDIISAISVYFGIDANTIIVLEMK